MWYHNIYYNQVQVLYKYRVVTFWVMLSLYVSVKVYSSLCHVPIKTISLIFSHQFNSFTDRISITLFYLSVAETSASRLLWCCTTLWNFRRSLWILVLSFPEGWGSSAGHSIFCRSDPGLYSQCILHSIAYCTDYRYTCSGLSVCHKHEPCKIV